MVKKFISIVVVLAAIFCAVPMRGDSPPEFTIEIPIKKPGSHDTVRSLYEIQTYYYGMFSTVYTSVTSDLGEVEVIVTNCTSGEFWEDTFDSSISSQHLLQISGTSGFYEVTYTTENGNLYEGSFVLNNPL